MFTHQPQVPFSLNGFQCDDHSSLGLSFCHQIKVSSKAVVDKMCQR